MNRSDMWTNSRFRARVDRICSGCAGESVRMRAACRTDRRTSPARIPEIHPRIECPLRACSRAG
jgi:hypothetical protein